MLINQGLCYLQQGRKDGTTLYEKKLYSFSGIKELFWLFDNGSSASQIRPIMLFSVRPHILLCIDSSSSIVTIIFNWF